MPETPVPPASLTGAIRQGYLLAGRYALARLIARGGMADVWEAKDTLLERQVAVKILHPHLAADAAFVARFRTEAVAAARLHHRSIVAIFDTCSDSGIEAIVMELVRGHTLREEIDRHGALDPLVVINIGVDVADALQSAHAAGLIHRDVKPANILLCDDQRVMVTDFGIAKVRDNSDRTQTGTMLGSVKYVSPEQVEGKPVDPRSDVYSLGIVLYESLTAQPPFASDSPAATALLRLHTTAPHPRQVRPDAPRALADLIAKAMSREPADRYASAADVRAALLATRLSPDADSLDLTQVAPRPGGGPGYDATTAAPRRVRPTPPPPRRGSPDGGARPSQSHRGALIGAILVVVAALIVATILLKNRGSDTAKAGASGATVTTKAAGGAGRAPGPTVAPAATGAPVTLEALDSFDPQGVGTVGEGDDSVPLATDGKAETGWHTECYGRTNFGTGAKTGVGLVVDNPGKSKIGKLTLTSPSQGWSVQVFTSDSRPGDLAGWGRPAAEASDIKGSAELQLNGASGRYVLVWVTQLPASPSTTCAAVTGYSLAASINEISATAA